MNVYITRTCLSNGIIRKNALPCKGHGMIKYAEGNSFVYCQGQGKQWHRTFAGALAKAEQMRYKRLATLRAEISRLEALTFIDPEREG